MMHWTRRKFLQAGTTLIGAGASLAAAREYASVSPAALKAREVREHLLALGAKWINPTKTKDTFQIGDPETVIRGIAVAWAPYTETVKRAIDLGCNLLMAHEPLFYSDHLDFDGKNIFALEGAKAKRTLLEQSGVVVYRCYDVWNQMPGIGITDAWAHTLGLSNPIGGAGYFRVFDGAGKTAKEVARDVARRTKQFGQPGVHLLGRDDRRVHRIAIGCGGITPFHQMVSDLGADLAICADEGFVHWRSGALATDLDVPVIIVSQAVAAAEGIRNLAAHLRKAFPAVKVDYLAEGCPYRHVAA